MNDEPTLGELGRLIQALRGDVRDDMAQIQARLDRLVPTDVYAVEKAAMVKEIADLAKALEQLSAKEERDVTAIQHQRTEDARQLTQTRRWMVGAVISLLGLVLPVILFVVGGMKS